jgi:hypothetical protein
MFQLCSQRYLTSGPASAVQPKRDYRELTGNPKGGEMEPENSHYDSK